MRGHSIAPLRSGIHPLLLLLIWIRNFEKQDSDPYLARD